MTIPLKEAVAQAICAEDQKFGGEPWAMLPEASLIGATRQWYYALAGAALAVAGSAIRERCAAYVDCGCPRGPEAVRAAKRFGHNSAQRWSLCGESICAALEAHEIRSMTDE